MKAEDLKERLTVEGILSVMDELGAEMVSNDDKEVIFKTICHGGDSSKLYFYKDNKIFKCYSHCGSMDIITIVQKVKDLGVADAISFICNTVGIIDFNMREGFGGDSSKDENWEIIKSLMKSKKEISLDRDFKFYDPSILMNFRLMFHPAFLNDGISIETMIKFKIRYDLLNRRIIIPHFHENGNLIGIRCRNLDQDLIDAGCKYVPIMFKKERISAPTGKYLYGLNENKHNIRKIKRVILVESEKAVMQLDSILENNFSVAMSGSSLSLVQVNLLVEYGVEEVIVAVDKEYEQYGTQEEKLYAQKIKKSIIDKLIGKFNVSVIWDKTNLLKKKDSPTDRGREVFLELYKNRIKVV